MLAVVVSATRRLHEIENEITGETTAAFEPAIDYVVTKIPRWPKDKFDDVDFELSTAMKSTGGRRSDVLNKRFYAHTVPIYYSSYFSYISVSSCNGMFFRWDTILPSTGYYCSQCVHLFYRSRRRHCCCPRKTTSPLNAMEHAGLVELPRSGPAMSCL